MIRPLLPIIFLCASAFVFGGLAAVIHILIEVL